MGIGVSIFLLAVGAILTFAISADAEGVNLDTIGWILMIVGAIGIVVSMIFAARHRDDATHGRVVERERV